MLMLDGGEVDYDAAAELKHLLPQVRTLCRRNYYYALTFTSLLPALVLHLVSLTPLK